MASAFGSWYGNERVNSELVINGLLKSSIPRACNTQVSVCFAFPLISSMVFNVKRNRLITLVFGCRVQHCRV